MDLMDDELTPEEKGVIGLVRYNKLYPRTEVNWCRDIGRLHIAYNWRSKKNLWGRFGGGWNWVLGFEAGGKTLAFQLLIARLSFSWTKPS